MRSLFETFLIEAQPLETPAEVKARASEAGRRIASTLLAAELAGSELQWTRDELNRAVKSGDRLKIESARARLAIAKSYHLRECLSTAIEMQKGLADALGQWLLSECTAGTGLSKAELKTLIEVSGGTL